MANQPKVSLGNNEHIFIPGMTGSGKTYLAQAYASGFKRVTKLDTKGEALQDLEEGKNPWSQVNKKELIVVETLQDYIDVYKDKYPYIIYAPQLSELNEYTYEQFFQFQYISKNNTTWIDELMEVNDNPSNIGYWLKGLYTRGRSRKSNVIACTQRPTGVHQLSISQSTHLFCFDLNLPQDREKIAKVSGAAEFLNVPGWHYFWYWRQGWSNAVKGIMG